MRDFANRMKPRPNRPIVARGTGRRSPRIELQIDKLVYGGLGLGRHEGKVAFVPFAAPGDRVAIRVTEERRNYIRGSILEVLEDGPDRAAPACPLFGACGGCQWQHLDYAGQVEAKRRILVELFHHRFPETSALDITMLGSPRALGYRSRARLQLRGSGASSVVGFFRSQSDEVEDVPACPLFRPLLGRALEQVRIGRRAGEGDPRLTEIAIAASEEAGTWGAPRVMERPPPAFFRPTIS